MNATANGAGRTPKGPAALAPGSGEASRDAKRLAAIILEVLAGERTPTQAAQALEVSLPRYYQLESRGLGGLVGACERVPKGRQRTPAREANALRKENERLRRDLTRQQSLVRLAQRTVGLSPPLRPDKTGPQKRRRKPTARALSAAARLRQEAEAVENVTADGPEVQ
jgi:hypothetical protein